MNVLVVGNVVPVVAQGRGVERQEPETVDAETLQVIELLRQTGKVADAVAVAVEEYANVRLIDNRVFVPEMVKHDPPAPQGMSRAEPGEYGRHDPADRDGRSSTLRARNTVRPIKDPRLPLSRAA